MILTKRGLYDKGISTMPADYLNRLRQLSDFSFAVHEQQRQEWSIQIKNAIEKESLRILIVLSQQPGQTGSGIFLRETVQQLQDLGHRPYLLAGHYYPLSNTDFQSLSNDQIHTLIFDNENNSEIAEVSFPIPGMSPDMPYLHLGFDKLTEQQIEEYCAAWIGKIRMIAEQIRPHIIHVNHLWLLPGIARIAMPWMPIIGTAHGTGHMLLEANPSYSSLVVPGIRLLDGVMAVSKETGERSIHKYDINPNRVRVIGNGFNPDLFKTIARERCRSFLDIILSRFDNLPKWDKLVLYVGKFAGYKGLPYLIRAARHYSDVGEHNILTLIVGGGSTALQHELEKIIEVENMQDRVLLTGKIEYEKVRLVMNMADVFVLPSIYEPFGLVLLEALACGVRCVATEQGGPAYFVPQELRDKGLVTLVKALSVNSDLIALRSEEERHIVELADAILYQAHQETSDIDREFISVSVRNYTWKACAERIAQIYLSVVQQHIP